MRYRGIKWPGQPAEASAQGKAGQGRAGQVRAGKGRASYHYTCLPVLQRTGSLDATIRNDTV